MIKGEFKKNYNFWLFMLVFSGVLVVTAIILAMVLSNYVLFVIVAIAAILAIFSAYNYLVFKKQYLVVSENGLDSYVVTFKGARKPMKIQNKLSFIIEAKTKGNLLILVNERGQELPIYNLKNAKEVAKDINNLIGK